MTLTLHSKVSWSSSIRSRRTSCSGRGTGALNFGLRTITGASAPGWPEALMAASPVERRRPKPCAPAAARARPHYLDNTPETLTGEARTPRFSRSQPEFGGFRHAWIVAQLTAELHSQERDSK